MREIVRFRFLLICLVPLFAAQTSVFADPIDREEVVSRHNVLITETMAVSPAQVGNGKFAFGVDITGLQSFKAFNTMSEWGWNSVPLPEGISIDDYKPTYIETYGKNIPYLLFDSNHEEISSWLRWNPHKVNLGRLGFVLIKADGTAAVEKDLDNALQHVNIWTGLVSSEFVLEGKKVKVRTSCDPQEDMIAVSVESELLSEGRLRLFLEFPATYDKSMQKFVGDFSIEDGHTSSYGPIPAPRKGWAVSHSYNDLSYKVFIESSSDLKCIRERTHRYVLVPDASDRFEFTAHFTKAGMIPQKSVAVVEKDYADSWERYWMSGAAVDFSGSRDTRWKELERRVVLSQYVMRLNECGPFPPQESGLVNNGWYGRYHWEMIWWHCAHWQMWNRMDCFNSYLGIYNDFLQGACERAQNEGRKGAKWPKCTGADINREWPAIAHALLCWQQPHPIYFAEQDYRTNPTRETLEKWKDVVIATADYMADYLFWDKDRKEYVIAPPVVLVSENTDYLNTWNPTFELVYFRYGLRTALKWADRLDLPAKRTRQWKRVLEKMAPLPVEDGVYVTYEGIPDMWTRYNFEHPALAGAFGWMPGDGVDIETFRRTFHKVLECWKLDKAWGWDYAVLAMAAARLGEADKAVDLLTTTEHKFNFDIHGFADVWPFPYFPANGGLLAAIAMMCEGWDGSEGQAPGFPKDGSWTVRYEGFNKVQ